MTEGKRTRTWIKRLILAVLAVLLVVLAVISAVLIALQTESGRKRVGDFVTEAASSDHFKLELKGLGRGLPWHLGLAEFSLADAHGVWLSGENLEVEWSPLELVWGRIRVSRLQLSSLTMTRVPQGQPQTAKETEPTRPEDLIKTAEELTLPDLAVDKLLVDRVVLAPPLTPNTRTYAISGSVAAAGFIGRTELAVTDFDHPDDGLKLVAARQGPPAALDLDLKVREGAGGLLGSLAGWPADSSINLTLAGTGPLTDWQGQLAGAIDNVVQAQTSLHLSAGLETVVGLEGRIEAPEGVLPEEMVGYLGRSGDFKIELHSDLSGREPVLSLKKVVVDTPKVQAKVDLTVDVGAETVTGALVAVGKDMSHLAESAGVEVENGVTINGVFSGSLAEPHVRLTGDLGRVSVAGMSSGQTSIDLKVKTVGLFWQGLETEGLVTFHEFESPWPEMLPPDMTFDFDAALPGYARLDLPRADLSGKWLKVKAKGGLDFNSLEFNLSTDNELDDLKHLPSSGLGFGGQPRVQAVLSGRIPDQVLAEVKGRIEGLKGLPPEPDALLGPDVDLLVRAELKEAQLDISDLQVKGRSEIKGSGSLDLDGGTMNLDWQADVQNLARVAEMHQMKSSPSAQVKGRVEGKFTDFTATAEARVPELVSGGQKFSEVTVRAEAASLPKQIKGRADISAKGDGGDLTATSNLALEENQFKLAGLNVKAPGADLQGELAINLQSQLTTGQARVQAADLAALGRFLGQPLAGTAGLDIKLVGNGGQQGLVVSGQASRIRYDQLQAESIKVTADLGDLKNLLITKADLSLQGLKQGQLNVDQAGLKVVSGDKGKIRFKTQAEGRYQHPFKIAVAGETNATGLTGKGPWQLVVESLQGQYAKEKVALVRPVTVREDRDGLAVDGLELDLASGRITGQGTLGREVAADLTFKDLSLRPVALFSTTEMKGLLNGNVTLSGPAADPTLDVSLLVGGIKVGAPGADAVPKLDLDLNCHLGQGTFQGKVEVKGLGDQPGLVEFALPAKLSLEPFLLDLPTGGQLSGRVEADLKLALLPPVLGLEGQTMAGRGRLQLTLAGSLDEPEIFGQVTVAEGLYQNIDLGLYFKDIEADLEATQNEIKLAKVRATDGGGGVVTADGSLSLNPERRFPYHISVNMDNARLVRMDLLSTTGTGQVVLSGDTKEAKLSGAMTMNPTEVNIPQSLPPSVTSVEVSQINVPPSERTPAEAPQTAGLKLNLDVDLSFPERFYVRGAGLDSEWKGAVKVTRTAAAPGLRGKLDIVRGRYEFLGKDFKLTRGSLTFDGSNPPAPWINVVGESKATDITAMVSLSGSPAMPEITLESDPPLPQDEILARVLFGKDLSKVSPVQALRLAQAANELAGGKGPKLNLLENARKELGLDQLDVRTGDSGDTAVGAGKYLSEDVYVEAQGGAKPEDQKVSVEIELTPNISLETEVGADSQGGGIIQWKMDYQQASQNNSLTQSLGRPGLNSSNQPAIPPDSNLRPP